MPFILTFLVAKILRKTVADDKIIVKMPNLTKNPESRMSKEETSMESPLILSKIIPSIINNMPINSPFFNDSPRIFMEPIANTINPALIRPGTNAGPRRDCASK